MAGLVSVSEVRAGGVDLVDILKLNALLDAQEAAQQKAANSMAGRR
ncbi:hypothetical protein CURE108131_10990 [Cupriavidus respiraculi]|uniref:Uncharacterized protein n=1 Tax=Cupriavidus respiraculi TaxID=195930 RepID=A0ABM8WXL5_9BURK|nr:hypothetical protein [Cupriavidus respiraculi]MBY4945412.1 hypothetical protein [Cupriavidus respiraculi]CAG9172284.1 hypothetical protein LMG21510_01923 [Cupriavidus respiraculi]